MKGVARDSGRKVADREYRIHFDIVAKDDEDVDRIVHQIASRNVEVVDWNWEPAE